MTRTGTGSNSTSFDAPIWSLIFSNITNLVCVIFVGYNKSTYQNILDSVSGIESRLYRDNIDAITVFPSIGDGKRYPFRGKSGVGAFVVNYCIQASMFSVYANQFASSVTPTSYSAEDKLNKSGDVQHYIGIGYH